MEQMVERVKNDMANQGTVKSMFQIALKPFLLAMSLMVLQQLSGINAALFNAVSIFESAGSTIDPLISAVLLNVTQVRLVHFSYQLCNTVTVQLDFKGALFAGLVCCGGAHGPKDAVHDLGRIHGAFNGRVGRLFLLGRRSVGVG